MRFVEVEGVSRGLTALFRTASDSGACQCGARDFFGVARLFRNSPGSSDPLGFQSGRAVRRYVEVVGVRTKLTSFFLTAAHSGACCCGAPDFSGVARLLRNSPGSSEPLVFQSGRAVTRWVEVADVRTRLTSFFRTASHSGACYSGSRYFSGVARLFRNSPGSSDPLGFQSGRAVTRWVEVAGVRTQAHPLLSHMYLPVHSLSL